MADALVRPLAVRVLDPFLEMDWSQLEFKMMREGTIKLKDVNLKRSFVKKIIPDSLPLRVEDVSVREGELDVRWTLGKAITAFWGTVAEIPATLTLYGVNISLATDLDRPVTDATDDAGADAASNGAAGTQDRGKAGHVPAGAGARQKAVAVMSAMGGGRYAEAGAVTVEGEPDDAVVGALPKDPQLWRTLEAVRQETRQVQEGRMARYDKQPDAKTESASQRVTATGARILEQSGVVVLKDLTVSVRHAPEGCKAPFECQLRIESLVVDASRDPTAFREAVAGLERRARNSWTRSLSVTGLAMSLQPLATSAGVRGAADSVKMLSRRARAARARAAEAAATRKRSEAAGKARASAGPAAAAGRGTVDDWGEDARGKGLAEDDEDDEDDEGEDANEDGEVGGPSPGPAGAEDPGASDKGGRWDLLQRTTLRVRATKQVGAIDSAAHPPELDAEAHVGVMEVRLQEAQAHCLVRLGEDVRRWQRREGGGGDEDDGDGHGSDDGADAEAQNGDGDGAGRARSRLRPGMSSSDSGEGALALPVGPSLRGLTTAAPSLASEASLMAEYASLARRFFWRPAVVRCIARAGKVDALLQRIEHVVVPPFTPEPFALVYARPLPPREAAALLEAAGRPWSPPVPAPGSDLASQLGSSARRSVAPPRPPPVYRLALQAVVRPSPQHAAFLDEGRPDAPADDATAADDADEEAALRRMFVLEQSLGARGGKAALLACRTLAEEELRAEFRARRQRSIMRECMQAASAGLCSGSARRHEQLSVPLATSIALEADAAAAVSRCLRDSRSGYDPQAAAASVSGPSGLLALPLVAWCAMRGDFLPRDDMAGAAPDGDEVVAGALAAPSADALAGVAFVSPGAPPAAEVPVRRRAGAAAAGGEADEDEDGAASGGVSRRASTDLRRLRSASSAAKVQPRSYQWLRHSARRRWRLLRSLDRARGSSASASLRAIRQELDVDLTAVVGAVRVAQSALAQSKALSDALGLAAVGDGPGAAGPGMASPVRLAGRQSARAAETGWITPRMTSVLGASVRRRAGSSRWAPWSGGGLAGAAAWEAEAGTDESSLAVPVAAAAALYAARLRSLAARGHSDLPDGYQRYRLQLTVSHVGAEVVAASGSSLFRLALDGLAVSGADRKDACRDIVVSLARAGLTADPGVEAEDRPGLGRALLKALRSVLSLRPRALQAPPLAIDRPPGAGGRSPSASGLARITGLASAGEEPPADVPGSSPGQAMAAGSAHGVRSWAGTVAAAELAASAARALFGVGAAAWAASLAEPTSPLPGERWTAMDRAVGRALRAAGMTHTRGGFRGLARWIAIARELDAAEELTVLGSGAREAAAHALGLQRAERHPTLAGVVTPEGRAGGVPGPGRPDSEGSPAADPLPAGTRSAWRTLQHATARFFERAPGPRSILLDEDACAALVVFATARARVLMEHPAAEADDKDGPLGLHPLTADGGRWAGLVDPGGSLDVDFLMPPAATNALAGAAVRRLRPTPSSPSAQASPFGRSTTSGFVPGHVGASPSDGRHGPGDGHQRHNSHGRGREHHHRAQASRRPRGGRGRSDDASARHRGLAVLAASVHPTNSAQDSEYHTALHASPEVHAKRFVDALEARMDEPKGTCAPGAGPRSPGADALSGALDPVARGASLSGSRFLGVSTPVSHTPLPAPDRRLRGVSAARWNRWVVSSVGHELVLLARHVDTCLTNTDPADLLAVAHALVRRRLLRRSAPAAANVPSRLALHLESLIPHAAAPVQDAAGAAAALPAPGALFASSAGSPTRVASLVGRLTAAVEFLVALGADTALVTVPEAGAAASSPKPRAASGPRPDLAAANATLGDGEAGTMPTATSGLARDGSIRELRTHLELLASYLAELLDLAVMGPFLDSQWCPYARAFAWRASSIDRPLTAALPRLEVLRALQGRFAFLDRRRRDALARVAFQEQERLLGLRARGAGPSAAAAARTGHGSTAPASPAPPPGRHRVEGSRETMLDEMDLRMVGQDASRAAVLMRNRSESSSQWWGSGSLAGALATAKAWSAGFLGSLGLGTRGSLLDGTAPLHPLMEAAVEDGDGLLGDDAAVVMGGASASASAAAAAVAAVGGGADDSLPVYTVRHVLVVRASTSGRAGGLLDEGDADDVAVGTVLPRLVAAEAVAMAGVPAAMTAAAAEAAAAGVSAPMDRLQRAAVEAAHGLAGGSDVPWTYAALRAATAGAALGHGGAGGGWAPEPRAVTSSDMDELLGRVADGAALRAGWVADADVAGWAVRDRHESRSDAGRHIASLPHEASALPEGGTCLQQGKFRMAVLKEAGDAQAELEGGAGGLLGRVADWVPVYAELDDSGAWLRCYRSRTATRAEAVARAPIAAGVMVLGGDALAARGGRPADGSSVFGSSWYGSGGVSSEVVAAQGLCVMEAPSGIEGGTARVLLLVADTVDERQQWTSLLRACVRADEAARADTEDVALREAAARRLARTRWSVLRGTVLDARLEGVSRAGPDSTAGGPGVGGGGSRRGSSAADMADTADAAMRAIQEGGREARSLRPDYADALSRQTWVATNADWRSQRPALARVRAAPLQAGLSPGLFASVLAFARRIDVGLLAGQRRRTAEPAGARSRSEAAASSIREAASSRSALGGVARAAAAAGVARARARAELGEDERLSGLFGGPTDDDGGAGAAASPPGAAHPSPKLRSPVSSSAAPAEASVLGTIDEEPEPASRAFRRTSPMRSRQGAAMHDSSDDEEDCDGGAEAVRVVDPGRADDHRGPPVIAVVLDRIQVVIGAVENTGARRAAGLDAPKGAAGPADDLESPAAMPRRAVLAGPSFTGVRFTVSVVTAATVLVSPSLQGRLETRGRTGWDPHTLSGLTDAVAASAPHSTIAAAFAASRGQRPGPSRLRAAVQLPAWAARAKEGSREDDEETTLEAEAPGTGQGERTPGHSGGDAAARALGGATVRVESHDTPHHVAPRTAMDAVAAWGDRSSGHAVQAPTAMGLTVGSVRVQAFGASGKRRASTANAIPGGAIGSDWLAGAYMHWCTHLLSAGPLVAEVCDADETWPAPELRRAPSVVIASPSEPSPSPAAPGAGRARGMRTPSRRRFAGDDAAAGAAKAGAVASRDDEESEDDSRAGSDAKTTPASRSTPAGHASPGSGVGSPSPGVMPRGSARAAGTVRSAWVWLRSVEVRVGLGSLAPVSRVATRWVELRRFVSREMEQLVGSRPAAATQAASPAAPGARGVQRQTVGRGDVILEVARASVGTVTLVIEGEGSGEDRRPSRLRERLPQSVLRARRAVQEAAAVAAGEAAAGADSPLPAGSDHDYAFRELLRATLHRAAVLGARSPPSIGVARTRQGASVLVTSGRGAGPQELVVSASLGQAEAWEPARWVESRGAAVWPRLSAAEHAVSRGRCILVGDPIAGAGAASPVSHSLATAGPAAGGAPAADPLVSLRLVLAAGPKKGRQPAAEGDPRDLAAPTAGGAAPPRPNHGDDDIDDDADDDDRYLEPSEAALVREARRAAMAGVPRIGGGMDEDIREDDATADDWPATVSAVTLAVAPVVLTPDLTTVAFLRQWGAHAGRIGRTLAAATAPPKPPVPNDAGPGDDDGTGPDARPGPRNPPRASALTVATVELGGLRLRASAFNSPLLVVAVLPATVRASLLQGTGDDGVASSRRHISATAGGASVVLCRSADWFVRPIARPEAAHPSAASMRASDPQPEDSDPWNRMSPSQALARRVWLRRRLLQPAASDLSSSPSQPPRPPDTYLTEDLLWSVGASGAAEDSELLAVQRARDASREAFAAAAAVAASVEHDPFLCPTPVRAAVSQALPAVWSGVEGGVVRVALGELRADVRDTSPATPDRAGRQISLALERAAVLVEPDPRGVPPGARRCMYHSDPGPAVERGAHRRAATAETAAEDPGSGPRSARAVPLPSPRRARAGASHSRRGSQRAPIRHHRVGSATSVSSAAAAAAASAGPALASMPLKAAQSMHAAFRRWPLPPWRWVYGRASRDHTPRVVVRIGPCVVVPGADSSGADAGPDTARGRRRKGEQAGAGGPAAASSRGESSRGGGASVAAEGRRHQRSATWTTASLAPRERPTGPAPPFDAAHPPASSRWEKQSERWGLVVAVVSADREAWPADGDGYGSVTEVCGGDVDMGLDPLCLLQMHQTLMLAKEAMRCSEREAHPKAARHPFFAQSMGGSGAAGRAGGAPSAPTSSRTTVAAASFDAVAPTRRARDPPPFPEGFDSEAARETLSDASAQHGRGGSYVSVRVARAQILAHALADGARRVWTAADLSRAADARGLRPGDLPPSGAAQFAGLRWLFAHPCTRGAVVDSFHAAAQRLEVEVTVRSMPGVGSQQVTHARMGTMLFVDVSPSPATVLAARPPDSVIGAMSPATARPTGPVVGFAARAGCVKPSAVVASSGQGPDLHPAWSRLAPLFEALDSWAVRSEDDRSGAVGDGGLAVPWHSPLWRGRPPAIRLLRASAVAMARQARDVLKARRQETLSRRDAALRDVAAVEAEAVARAVYRDAVSALGPEAQPVGAGTGDGDDDGEQDDPEAGPAGQVAGLTAAGDGAATPRSASGALSSAATPEASAPARSGPASGDGSIATPSSSSSSMPQSPTKAHAGEEPDTVGPASLSSVRVTFQVGAQKAAAAWVRLALPRPTTRMAALARLLRADRSRSGEHSIGLEEVTFASDTELPVRPPPAERAPASHRRHATGRLAPGRHGLLPSPPDLREAALSSTAFAAFARRPGTDGVLLAPRDHTAATLVDPGDQHGREGGVRGRVMAYEEAGLVGLDLPVSWTALDVLDARRDAASADPALVMQGLVAAVARRGLAAQPDEEWATVASLDSGINQAQASAAEAAEAAVQQAELERKVLSVRASGLPLWNDEATEADGALGMYADEEDEQWMRSAEGGDLLGQRLGGDGSTLAELGVLARPGDGDFAGAGGTGDDGGDDIDDGTGAGGAGEGRRSAAERTAARVARAVSLVSPLDASSWATLGRLITPLGLAAEAEGSDAGLGDAMGVGDTTAPTWARRRSARLGRAQMPPRGPGCEQLPVDRRRTLRTRLFLRDARAVYVPRFVNEVMALQGSLTEAGYGRVVWRLGDLPPPPALGFPQVELRARRFEVLIPASSCSDDSILRIHMGSLRLRTRLETVAANHPDITGLAPPTRKSSSGSGAPHDTGPRAAGTVDLQVIDIPAMHDVVYDQPPFGAIPALPPRGAAAARASYLPSHQGMFVRIPSMAVTVREPLGQLSKLACPLTRLLRVRMPTPDLTISSAVPTLMAVQQAVNGSMRELSPLIRNPSRPFGVDDVQQMTLTTSDEAVPGTPASASDPAAVPATPRGPACVEVHLTVRAPPGRLPELREMPFPDDPLEPLPTAFLPDFAGVTPPAIAALPVPDASTARGAEELHLRVQAHRLAILAGPEPASPPPLPPHLSPDALTTAAAAAGAGGQASRAALLAMSLSVLLATPASGAPAAPALGPMTPALPASLSVPRPREPHADRGSPPFTTTGPGAGGGPDTPPRLIGSARDVASLGSPEHADEAQSDALAKIERELEAVAPAAAPVDALQGELGAGGQGAAVLRHAALALRRVLSSAAASPAGGAEAGGALDAVARIARLLEAAQGPAEDAARSAEEQAALLAEQNAFLLSQLVEMA